MNNLKYRRQFVLSSQKLKNLDTWQTFSIANENTLYVHPDLSVVQAKQGKKEITLIGLAVDATAPQKNNQEIANTILTDYEDWNNVIDSVYPLGGRWIVFATNGDEFKAISDPCALRMLFYVTDKKQPIICASQPLLIKDYCDLEIDLEFKKDYLDTGAMQENKEFWYLAKQTQFKNVKHLSPNHFVDFNTRDQHRFYPLKTIPTLSYEEGMEKTILYLKNLIVGLSKRSKLALAITGGYDSRLTLAACKDIKEDLYCYTSKYYGMNDTHPDISKPAKLLPMMGLKHHIIDCEGEMSPEFREIYMNNIDLPHESWGGIVENLSKKYPQDRITIKSACCEIARCAFYKDGYPKKVDVEWLGSISTFEKSPLFMQQLEEWFNEMNPFVQDKNIDILDIYYWEHRCGYWQAGSQLEFDLAQEEFTPFSCRILVDTMLGVPIKHRSGTQFPFFQDAMKRMWPESLLLPYASVYKKRKKTFMKKFRKTFFGRIYYKIMREAGFQKK